MKIGELVDQLSQLPPSWNVEVQADVGSLPPYAEPGVRMIFRLDLVTHLQPGGTVDEPAVMICVRRNDNEEED